MKIRFGSRHPSITSMTSPSSDIKYCSNYLLYKESKINGWNISHNIKVRNYDKCMLSKIANTYFLI